MKISKFVVVSLCVAALSVGAGAGQAASADSDTAAVQAVSAPAQKPAQSKQTSVQRPTKKTNWSKIKTLFE